MAAATAAAVLAVATGDSCFASATAADVVVVNTDCLLDPWSQCVGVDVFELLFSGDCCALLW